MLLGRIKTLLLILTLINVHGGCLVSFLKEVTYPLRLILKNIDLPGLFSITETPQPDGQHEKTILTLLLESLQSDPNSVVLPQPLHTNRDGDPLVYNATDNPNLLNEPGQDVVNKCFLGHPELVPLDSSIKFYIYATEHGLKAFGDGKQINGMSVTEDQYTEVALLYNFKRVLDKVVQWVEERAVKDDNGLPFLYHVDHTPQACQYSPLRKPLDELPFDGTGYTKIDNPREYFDYNYTTTIKDTLDWFWFVTNGNGNAGMIQFCVMRENSWSRSAKYVAAGQNELDTFNIDSLAEEEILNTDTENFFRETIRKRANIAKIPAL